MNLLLLPTTCIHIKSILLDEGSQTQKEYIQEKLTSGNRNQRRVHLWGEMVTGWHQEEGIRGAGNLLFPVLCNHCVHAWENQQAAH